MKNDPKLNGLVHRLRDWVDGAIARLAKHKPSQANSSTPSTDFAAPDPTKILFPDHAATSSADQVRQPLSYRLETSAESLETQRQLLSKIASELRDESRARSNSEKTLNIQSIRLLIASGWLGLAFWLHQSVLRAQASDAELANGVPLEHAAALSKTFAFAGGIGFAAAILMIAIVFIFGSGTNDALRSAGEDIGEQLAAIANRFNDDLEQHHRIITDENQPPANILPAVSQAHLTALEARHYFDNIPFLTTPDPDRARRRFVGFIKRYSPSSVGVPLGEAIFAIILCSLISAGGAYLVTTILLAQDPATPNALSSLATVNYPWAMKILGYGGLAYLFTGLAVNLFFGVLGNRQMTKAHKEALDAVRSAYTANEAPLAADVIRQVEDVVEILRARLTGARDKANQSADFAGAGQVPEWRSRDSSVKFVDTGFHSTPTEWRTDAYQKKFDAGEPRETGSKRGVQDTKNKRGD